MLTNFVVLAFAAGALSGLVVAGSIAWVKHLGLKMTWWKWLLAALWYLLLNFFVFLDFTLIGEGEAGAGLKMLLIQAMIMFALGLGLIRLIWRGHT